MAAAEKPRAPLRRIPASPSRRLLSIRCPSLKGLAKYTGTVATGSPGQLEGHGDAAAWESAFLAFVLRQRAPAARRLPSSPPLRNTSEAWPRQPGLAACGRGPSAASPKRRAVLPTARSTRGGGSAHRGPGGPFRAEPQHLLPGTHGGRGPLASLPHSQGKAGRGGRHSEPWQTAPRVWGGGAAAFTISARRFIGS